MRKCAALFAIVALAAACDRAPEATREWTPQDHDQPEQQQQGQPAPQGSGAPTTAQVLADTAWSQTCSACHGASGHGDGPNGALVKAPDLTDAAWQAKVSDQEIAERIRKGKGLMPPNDLPDSTINALVARIRAMRGR